MFGEHQRKENCFAHSIYGRWMVHNLGLTVAWVTTITSMKATASTKFSAVSRLLP